MLTGLGPIRDVLESPDVLEVMVVNGSDVWVESTTGIARHGSLSPTEVALLVEGISRLSHRRIDALSPILDARLPDGSRACVVLPPIALHGTSINIRKFPQRTLPLAVSAVTEWFSPHDRVVCAEDTAEIRFRHPHVVALQTRPANQDGMGAVTLHDLVRTSLRMRPDRLVVGEVRGTEVVDMLLALSSGHSGSWTTVHASSAAHTTQRLAALVLRHHPQWTQRDAIELVHSAVTAVVHITRLPTGRRLITDVHTLGHDTC
jgi:pilus assembly protein CpaF